MQFCGFTPAVLAVGQGTRLVVLTQSWGVARSDGECFCSKAHEILFVIKDFFNSLESGRTLSDKLRSSVLIQS